MRLLDLQRPKQSMAYRLRLPFTLWTALVTIPIRTEFRVEYYAGVLHT